MHKKYEADYAMFEKICARKRLTPYKVCKVAGLNQSVLSNWKSGRNAPSINTLMHVSKALHTSITRFIVESEVEE